MNFEQMLFSQGFGTRRDCRDLILSGDVSWNGAVVEDPYETVEPEGKSFVVKGETWPFFEKAIIAMNKPEGYECSMKPSFHPSVLTLLPAPLRNRNIQPVGRLDEDTTGLLILTDDGAFQHYLIHPKHHVAKIYRAVLKHPAEESLVKQLLGGVLLKDERTTVAASDCRITGEHEIELTLEQGKYHQVKRMVAAAGNRVETLTRIQFGALTLPVDLKPGEWKWISSRAEITGKKA